MAEISEENIQEIKADIPSRSKTTKIESNTPRIHIDEIDVTSLISPEGTKFILDDVSSEGGKTPLFGEKRGGKNAKLNIMNESELSMKDIQESIEEE